MLLRAFVATHSQPSILDINSGFLQDPVQIYTYLLDHSVQGFQQLLSIF